MKSLMLKDFLLLKSQGRTWLLIIVIGFMMAAFNQNAFGIGYIGILFGMAGVGTLSYDEFDHGYPFLFTLPFTRRQYVAEKYLFCIGLSFFGLLFGLIFSIAGSIITGEGWQIPGLLLTCSIIWVMSIIMSIVMIPLRIKFGSEQGKIISGLVLGLTFALIIIFSKTLLNPDASGAVSVTIVEVGIILAVLVLAIATSFSISFRIIKKKEF